MCLEHQHTGKAAHPVELGKAGGAWSCEAHWRKGIHGQTEMIRGFSFRSAAISSEKAAFHPEQGEGYQGLSNNKLGAQPPSAALS